MVLFEQTVARNNEKFFYYDTVNDNLGINSDDCFWGSIFFILLVLEVAFA